MLVVNDLEMARNVLIKDFDYFMDRRTFAMDHTSESNKIASNMLTMITGEKWRKVRSMMSPAFTSGKLKAMAPLIDQVGDEFVDYLGGLADKSEEFSAKEVLTSYTLDCIATCGFGVEAKSFKEPNGLFRKMVQKHSISSIVCSNLGESSFQVLQATGGDKGNRKQMINVMISMIAPSVSKALKLELFDGVSFTRTQPLLYCRQTVTNNRPFSEIRRSRWCSSPTLSASPWP